MVSLLALFPLFITLLVCVSAVYYIYRRKSLGQSICIQQAARMQNDLKTPLKKLLHMNPHAFTLRAQRAQADANVASATASAYPPAIAAAEAQQAAVIAQQTEFHGEQLALLMDAQRIRSEAETTLRMRALSLQAQGVQSMAYYFRPLAVEPKPPSDLSPNYEAVPNFTELQQHRFRYSIDLLSGFPGMGEVGIGARQTTECAVSLQSGEEDEWDIQILAAKAE
jgi:hypothetical protein